MTQTPHNHKDFEKIVTNEILQPQDTVLPVTQSVVWYRDFSKMIWESGIEKDLMLFIEILDDNGLHPVGITYMKVNNEDGSIKFGSYSLPVYQYPLKDQDNIENNDKLPYSIAFIINEPKPKFKPIEPPKPKPEEINIPQPKPEVEEQKLPIESEQQKLPIESEQQKLPIEPEQQKLPIEPEQQEKPEEEEEKIHEDAPKGNVDELFIPNTIKQYNEEQYDKKEIIVLYIDSIRFLPENCTYTQVAMEGLSSTGEVVIPQIVLSGMIDLSTCQKPYFGVREEISHEKTPKIDSSTILIFRIDTIERQRYNQV